MIITDPSTGLEVVQPCSSKGMSFADSIDALSKKKIEGKVWVLARGTPLPDGLVFNVREFDHPLLNVSRTMSVLELTCLLTVLAARTVIEEEPGALKRASSL